MASCQICRQAKAIQEFGELVLKAYATKSSAAGETAWTVDVCDSGRRCTLSVFQVLFFFYISISNYYHYYTTI